MFTIVRNGLRGPNGLRTEGVQVSEGDIRQESQGESRREFLKKAGKVAWVVPTLQVVNMSAALAGGDGTNGSVVVTSPPTTGGPECDCDLRETDRRPGAPGTAVIYFKLYVSEDCVEHAKYIHGYVGGQDIGMIPFIDEFGIQSPFELLPTTVRIDVLDDQQRVLASCSTRVEGMEDPQGAGAAAQGKGRLGFVT